MNLGGDKLRYVQLIHIVLELTTMKTSAEYKTQTWKLHLLTMK